MKLQNTHQISLTVLVSIGVGITICQPTSAATIYSSLELGSSTLESKSIFATGLNNLGQIVGNVIEDNGINDKIYGFRTSANSPINSATDYINAKNVGITELGSINDLGQVIGIFIDDNSPGNESFRTAPNSDINLTTDSLGYFGFGSPNGINNLGQVAFSINFLKGGTSSYRIDSNTPLNIQKDDIGNLGGITNDHFPRPYSFATDINDLGQVVGASLNTNLEIHAFRTAVNSSINPTTDDLGTLGGAESRANAINNLGQVVGESTIANGQTHAFIAVANSLINLIKDDLGTLGGLFSSAKDVNNLGQIVGTSETASGQTHAFLYEKGRMFDLNDLVSPSIDVTLNYVAGINDQGQIVAGYEPNNFKIPARAFLLTPIISNTSIPEESFGLGLSTFGIVSSVLIGRKKPKKLIH